MWEGKFKLKTDGNEKIYEKDDFVVIPARKTKVRHC